MASIRVAADARDRCSGFCSDPTISRLHAATSAHMLNASLSLCVCGQWLKMERLLTPLLLPVTQEVAGSSPVGPARFSVS